MKVTGFWEMPFNVERWRLSQSHIRMSLAQKGLYLELLAWQWSKGTIPSSPDEIAAIVGASAEEVAALWPDVADKFPEQADGSRANAELEEIRQHKRTVSERRTEAGRAGANARWRDKAD